MHSVTHPVDVAIIIINYNSSTFTIDCVESIYKHKPLNLNFEVIIIDNNSPKNDFEKLSQLNRYSNLKIIRSRINSGFAGGHMFGMQFTNPKYYFFLNNDCLFLNDCLTELYNFCLENIQTGLCAPQLFTQTMERHSTFLYMPTLASKLLGFGILRLLNKKKYPSLKKEYTQPLKVELLSGSALFVNAEAFHKIGGFDTIYFLYCEEEDLSLRLTKAGYNIYLVPAGHVQHIGFGSTEKNFNISKEYYISLVYFYNKHFGAFKTLILKIFMFFKIIKKSIKSFDNFKLAFFILFKTKPQNSLRHKQIINSN